MSWMNQIGNILEQYTGSGNQPANADNDFDQVTQAAPRPAMADGIAAAFRSDQTPPFAQMVSQMFGQASGQERAGLLNMLISVVGPGLVSQVLGQQGLSGLAGMLGGGQTQVTPQQAEQVPPEAVGQVAAQAEQQDPSIIERVSDFFADNPALVKTLGTAALGLVMSRMAGNRRAA